MSATIVITISTKDKFAEYTQEVRRTFPSDHAEGTARDYFNRLSSELWDGVSDERKEN